MLIQDIKQIELLAPAGDLNKLKVAINYGANAVYVGGYKFSLRARANNFTLEDLKEACLFAHHHRAKLYVTMNIIPHDSDLEGLVEYLQYLESIKVDAIIVSSMYIIATAREVAPKLEIHISTQTSNINSEACNAFLKLGANRVVLGREASLVDIKSIKKNTKASLEVFIHGGMCSSYSGRCVLSNHMVNRDANRGGCAHSCRWSYDLYDDENNKLNNEGFFHMASKDLMAVEMVSKLIDIGVDSLKIEGRMKSEYYIATVVKSYRILIDRIYNNKKSNLEEIKREIKKAENRETGYGFFYGHMSLNGQLYASCEIPSKEFVGKVLKYNLFTKIVTLEQRNYFKIGDTLEFFGPKRKNKLFCVKEIKNDKGDCLATACHPQEIIKLKIPFGVKRGDFIRLAKMK